MFLHPSLPPQVHRATLANETMVMSREKGTHAFMHSQGLCIAKSG
jgi:hypothetical protein